MPTARYFYVHDSLASVRQLIDAWTNVKNQFVYEAFELVFENSVDFDGLGLSARLGGRGRWGGARRGWRGWGHIKQSDRIIEQGLSYSRASGLKHLGGFDVKWSLEDS